VSDSSLLFSHNFVSLFLYVPIYGGVHSLHFSSVLYKISGSRGSEYEDNRLLGCSTI
jgi:hypothetical protein